MNEKIDTIIVGPGQGGLSLCYYLIQSGREHLVLEKAAQPGEAWRSHRWDSFTFVTPNWSFRLPGAEYNGPDPQGYMSRDEIVSRFVQYVERYRLPVRYGVTVSSVEPGAAGTGFTVQANGDTWQAKRVVIATGLFQRGKVPAFAAAIPAKVHQLESGQYRNPRALEPGAVLVVGSGQSGAQIAEELNQAGRKVYLCAGSAGRAPRRYRGRDIYEWIALTGFLDRTVDQLPSPQARFASPPLLTGKDGGHALNMHRFYRDGVTLFGHLRGFEDGSLLLAPDLQENLAKSAQQEANMLKMIDMYIKKAGITAPPPEPLEVLGDAYAAPEVLSLDIQQAGIATIIWAIGYRFDFSLVRFPVFEDSGFPITRGGVTQVPGLYFAGLPWLDTRTLLPIARLSPAWAYDYQGEETKSPGSPRPFCFFPKKPGSF
jgi:putative flavoprotein involved in K+ transport